MNQSLRMSPALLVLAVSSQLCAAQTPKWGAPASAMENSSPDPAPAQGDDPACPGQGSCCVGHGGPGCDNMTCCNNVCNVDFLCCFAWDSDCANLADSICGSACAGSCPGEGGCCTPHAGGGCSNATCCDLVCLHTPACCESGWSAACAALAVQICDDCDVPPVFECPQPGDCCSQRVDSTGCERSGCCDTVCSIDDYCCNTEWDDVCANLAIDNCINVCDCPEFGEFDANASVNLRDAAAMQNCFSGGDSTPVSAPCACADYDGDGDADLADFGAFAPLLAP